MLGIIHKATCFNFEPVLRIGADVKLLPEALSRPFEREEKTVLGAVLHAFGLQADRRNGHIESFHEHTIGKVRCVDPVTVNDVGKHKKGVSGSCLNPVCDNPVQTNPKAIHKRRFCSDGCRLDIWAFRRVAEILLPLGPAEGWRVLEDLKR